MSKRIKILWLKFAIWWYMRSEASWEKEVDLQDYLMILELNFARALNQDSMLFNKHYKNSKWHDKARRYALAQLISIRRELADYEKKLEKLQKTMP